VSLPLDGRVALITSARGNLGRAIIDAFVEAGARVFAVDRAYTDDEVPPQGVVHHRADLLDPDTPARAVAACLAALGRLDVLVCMGGGYLAETITTLTRSDWEREVRLGLTAPIFLTQAAVPALSVRGGAVVMIGSVHSVGSMAPDLTYSTTKSALLGVTRSLAAELGPLGIRVNALAPGYVPGDRVPDPARHEHAWLPLRRVGEPHEIASAALFLASDAASYVTGQQLVADGGMVSVLSAYGAVSMYYDAQREQRARTRPSVRTRTRRAGGRLLRRLGLRR
jgi:NAD(P)-dependent dehydrogenase (short-subunit alcohol dehydrogenase family)